MDKNSFLKIGIFLVVVGSTLVFFQNFQASGLFETSISEAVEENKTKEASAKDKKEQMELFQANKNLLDEIKFEQKKLEEKIAFIKEEEYRVAEAKREVETKLKAITKTEKYIKELLESQKIKDRENLEGLMLLYGSMKPKDAAKVFGNMKTHLVSEIIQIMPKRKAAKIMNVMKTKQAANITRILRNKNPPIKLKGRIE